MRFWGSTAIFAALIILVVPPVTADAHDITAGEMSAWCTSPSGSDPRLVCDSYTKGFVDAVSADVAMSKPAGICLPPQFTAAEAEDVFVRMVRTYPKMESGTPQTVLWAALSHQYPCP